MGVSPLGATRRGVNHRQALPPACFSLYVRSLCYNLAPLTRVVSTWGCRPLTWQPIVRKPHQPLPILLSQGLVVRAFRVRFGTASRTVGSSSEQFLPHIKFFKVLIAACSHAYLRPVPRTKKIKTKICKWNKNNDNNKDRLCYNMMKVEWIKTPHCITTELSIAMKINRNNCLHPSSMPFDFSERLWAGGFLTSTWNDFFLSMSSYLKARGLRGNDASRSSIGGYVHSSQQLLFARLHYTRCCDT